ncbi:O-antigen export system ATP-binding protein RfbB [Candidatus Methylobacter favarea]|uniref:O-antigen export system ATP-binding protein RfbB n=1 Tax=Candidatus Methylobacter favarea TaxID=2707345 RepID=A0A8S0XRX0_9GAMM|nr:ABC transporter ATP-binding protein [Candidatus Methylobacter favarea]CAA9890319.1 O-antigen export system ATP-binding protein RfbB [Candidatus Methylobacter favarea]
MSLEPAIAVKNLSKHYQLYAKPHDRLKQLLCLGRRQYYREFSALHELSFEVMPGEVVGIIGCNGSGKSTLLQLICGTLTPTTGEVAVRGRVAALLELGAGFNPEFTGRENVFLSAAIMGLPQQEIKGRFDEIAEFSGIREFIDQPVKTYSSGMYVRLAFAVATSVDPDILVIDEALSVGDGAFSRQSFNRIMQMRDNGKTILFCSHSLFQVESLCARAIWLNKGRIMAEGDSAAIVAAYQEFLDKSGQPPAKALGKHEVTPISLPPHGYAHIESVKAEVDGHACKGVIAISGRSCLILYISFASDPDLPCPCVAFTLHAKDGRTLTSAATWEDQLVLQRTPHGSAQVRLVFDRLPLLKGEYLLSVHLLCERGLHIYDSVNAVANLQVRQEGHLQGYFMMPHTWERL